MAIRIKEQSAWRSQVLVTKALLQREFITRFGKYKLGVIWVFVDPLLSVLVIGILLGPIMGRASGEVPYAFFLLCGFMLLNLFTGSITSSIGAISSNQGLLVFKKVQPLDPFIARFIFQLLTVSAALIIFCLIAAWFGVVLSVERLPEATACVVLTWLIGSGMGLHLGIAAMKVKELEKIIGYAMRPLLFLSAVLYPIDAIPPEYAKYLLYNPLVHTIEYLRTALFPIYTVDNVNLYYPATWALCSCSLGLMSYRNNRHFLTQR